MSGPGSVEQRWALVSLSAITWREYGDGVVLYNDTTGHTHQLSPLASEVLLVLLDHPAGLDMAGLLREIDSSIDMPAGISLRKEVERVLDQLEELQVVEQATLGTPVF